MIDMPDYTEEQLPQAAENAAYSLDVSEFEIQITSNSKVAVHKLRKPTLDELIKREEMSVYETEEIDKGQDKINVDYERANVALWDKIALQVKGYRTGSAGPEDWLTVDPGLAARISGAHKSTAIEGLYSSTCEVEQGEEDGFNLDGELFTVKQEIGPNRSEPDFIVRHTLRQPSESERQEYRRKASSTVLMRGSKKTKARVLTNLKASVDLYDKLFVGIEGVTGVEIGKELKFIDPLWKRQVVVALMQSFESSLSD